jgi:hypothetical protein
MVLERWQRVGAAREPRCRCPSLQHARDVSARPSSIRPQGAGHWDAYIRSKPAPEPARRRAAWSSSAISSCRGAGRGSVAKRPLSFPTRIFFQCSWSSSMALTAQPIAARSLADGPRLPNTQAPATLFHPLAPSRPQSHTTKESSATVTPLVCVPICCTAPVVHSARPVRYLQLMATRHTDSVGPTSPTTPRRTSLALSGPTPAQR